MRIIRPRCVRHSRQLSFQIEDLLLELASVTDRQQRLQYLLAWHRLIAVGADGGESLFVIHVHGKHARCLMDGRSGLGLSAVARHALDPNHAAGHVRGDFLAARAEQPGDVLGEEKEHDGEHRDRPEHDFV